MGVQHMPIEAIDLHVEPAPQRGVALPAIHRTFEGTLFSRAPLGFPTQHRPCCGNNPCGHDELGFAVERQPTTDSSAIDWQALLAQHDRWLRTVVFARVGEPQASTT